MSRRINERLYHATLYLVGAVVLLTAIAITGVRLALPDIGRHKDIIETWTGQYLEQTVKVDSISAEWQGWIPSLSLTGVQLRSRDGAKKIGSFDAAKLEISPLVSLWKRRPIPRRIVISGLRVSVSRLSDGALLVEEINIGHTDSDQENEFVKWLFGQDRIEVQDTSVTWIDHKHRQAPIHFTDVSLAIRTDGARSQLTGEMDLPNKYGEKMSIALDATGKLWTSGWSGEMYATATQVNPDSWYREFRPQQISPAGGSADLELWSSWEDAKPVGIQGRLAYRDFVVLSAGEAVNVAQVAGRFKGGKLPDTDWHFALKLDRVVTENGSWPASNLEFVIPAQTGQRHALSFDYLNLADLMPLAAGLEAIPDPIRRMLDSTSIRGELMDGLIVYDKRTDPAEALAYDFVFNNLDAGLGPDQPAVSELSGRLRGSDNRASITMSESAGQLSIPGLYSNQLRFKRIDGALSWSRTVAGWALHTSHFFMENSDLSLTIEGDIEQGEAHPLPYLNLITELRSKRLENMYSYMPYTPKFRIREWMERALHAGYVDSAIAVIRGYPDEFPFRNNNGQMRAVVNLSQSIVEYSDKWPIVDNVEAEILFDNEEMTANVRRGNVFGTEVTSATGVIHDLTKRPKVVVLEGNVRGAEKELELFISQSPLAQDKIIEYANQSLVAGAFDMDLNMSLPIKAPQLQSVIEGTLKLEEAKLVSDAGNVELEQVNGAVSFTRESISGSDLDAQFAGQPVMLSLSGSKNSPDKPPAFNIAGHSTDEFIIEQIVERFPGTAHFAGRLRERISGATDWNARFSFEQTPEGLAQHIDISADLYGLAIDLPKPFWKPTYSRRNLSVSKALQGTAPTELGYEPGIYARIHTGPDNSLERLDVSLGDRLQTQADGADVNLSGYTEKLALDELRDTVAFFTPDRADDPGFFRSANLNIDLETGLLSVFKQSYKDTRVQASRDKGDWRVNIQGEGLAGDMVIPHRPSPENRLQIKLDELVVSKISDDKVTSETDPKTLPPLQVDIADLAYGDYQLGSMQLSASPVHNGLSFEVIEFAKPGMTITGTGVWEKPYSRNKSNFNISLKADKIDKMLETFGYDVTAIKGGKTSISIDAGWEGSPDEFALDKLAGSFDIKVKKGRLLEVSPSAGRLFGLLSIQTLPRRLTLDFTDLFGKGLAFDKITGSFNITNGNAYTNDLHLTGPSADVLISGRTGLSDQDYDQLVTVTPQFADNLPIASALLGPVGIGVGAVLYLAGNMFESINDNIDKMLRYQYTITGNWHNPKIEKLKDPPDDKQVKAPPPSQPIYP